MKYCTNCIDVNTRPNSKFNSDGLCLSCENYFNENGTFDEVEKENILKKLFLNINQKRKQILIVLLVLVEEKIVHVRHYG